MPSDPLLPGAEGLLAERGHAAVDSFLGARGWSSGEITPVQALYHPGTSASVRFRVDATHRSGTRTTLSTTVESRREPHAGAVPAGSVPGLIPDPVGQVGMYGVFVFPYDPALPGLPDAAAGACLPDRLRPVAEVRQVDPLGYRPRHRAVLRYQLARDARTSCLFAKVLRPGRAKAVLSIARKVRQTEIPVRLGLPFARRGSGVLFSRALAGRPLRDLLLDSAPLPAPERLVRLGDRLAAMSADLPHDPSTRSPRGIPSAERVGTAAELLCRLVPDRAGMVKDVADRVAERTAGDPAPLRIVHGDLHEAQIMLADDGSLGLVDLDDLGWGDPILDAATLSTHLLALGINAPAAVAPEILAYRKAVRAAFIARLGCDEASLSWREAYAMLLLASGPFRVLRPDWPERVTARIELAADLLAGEA